MTPPGELKRFTLKLRNRLSRELAWKSSRDMIATSLRFLGCTPRLEFSAFTVFDTCCRYCGLAGSGALSAPGTGKGPFGGGSAVPAGIPKLALKKSARFAGVVANAVLMTGIG